MHSVQNYHWQKRLSREQKQQQEQRQQQQRTRPPRVQLQTTNNNKQPSRQSKDEEERRKGHQVGGAGGVISFKSVNHNNTRYSLIFHGIVISNISLVLLQNEFLEQIYIFEKRNADIEVLDCDIVINPDTGNKSLSATTPQPPPPPNIASSISIRILLSIDKLGKMKVYNSALVVSFIQFTYNSKYSG